MRNVSGASPSRLRRRRKARCVTNTMNHASMAPNMAIDIIQTNESSGQKALMNIATATPRLEIKIAATGTPLALVRPKRVGACPARARLNIMREVV